MGFLTTSNIVHVYYSVHDHIQAHQTRSVLSCERPPKPPTIRNSYTRTLILDTVMKFSRTVGATQNDDFDTHVCQILNLKPLIQQVNIGTKWSLQKHPKAVCQKYKISCTKRTHLKKSKVKGSSEQWPKRWPDDDNFLGFWVLADTSGISCPLTQTKPSGTMGDTKNDDHFSHVLSRIQ